MGQQVLESSQNSSKCRCGKELGVKRLTSVIEAASKEGRDPKHKTDSGTLIGETLALSLLWGVALFLPTQCLNCAVNGLSTDVGDYKSTTSAIKNAMIGALAS